MTPPFGSYYIMGDFNLDARMNHRIDDFDFDLMLLSSLKPATAFGCKPKNVYLPHFFCFSFLFMFMRKMWKCIFWQVFGVHSTQTLVQKPNTHSHLTVTPIIIRKNKINNAYCAVLMTTGNWDSAPVWIHVWSVAPNAKRWYTGWSMSWWLSLPFNRSSEQLKGKRC